MKRAKIFLNGIKTVLRKSDIFDNLCQLWQQFECKHTGSYLSKLFCTCFVQFAEQEERICKLEKVVQEFGSGPRSKTCVSRGARESNRQDRNRPRSLPNRSRSRWPPRERGSGYSSSSRSSSSSSSTTSLDQFQAHRRDRNRPRSLPNRSRSRSPPRERCSGYSSSSSSSSFSSSATSSTSFFYHFSRLIQAHRRDRNRLRSLPNRSRSRWRPGERGTGYSSSSSSSSSSTSTTSLNQFQAHRRDQNRPGHCQIEVGVDDRQGSAAQDIPAVPVQAPLLLPPLL